LVQIPADLTLITVVPVGTKLLTYPPNNWDKPTFPSNGLTKLSVSENRLNGPVPAPAAVNVIIIDIGILYINIL
jgi:hypothetical protein